MYIRSAIAGYGEYTSNAPISELSGKHNKKKEVNDCDNLS